MMKKIIIAIVIFFIVLISSYLIFIGDVDCPIKKITHLYCPACGTTRMLRSLLALDFYQAFRYNPLTFIIAFLCIFYIIYIIYSLITKKTIKYPSDKVMLTILFIVLLFGVLRNIPLFDFLLPTKLN